MNVFGHIQHYFDTKINEIAYIKGRPWDLMSWTAQRNLPTHEAIKDSNGDLCLTDQSLFETLHATYNSAANRPIDWDYVHSLPQREVRVWAPVADRELTEE